MSSLSDFLLAFVGVLLMGLFFLVLAIFGVVLFFVLVTLIFTCIQELLYLLM